MRDGDNPERLSLFRVTSRPLDGSATETTYYVLASYAGVAANAPPGIVVSVERVADHETVIIA